ncbi:MAG: hypothetical protein FJ271_33125 [Planctomycetes bacterium]|nr:hypothetical protein [Planctomycetota bacterium]
MNDYARDQVCRILRRAIELESKKKEARIAKGYAGAPPDPVVAQLDGKLVRLRVLLQHIHTGEPLEVSALAHGWRPPLAAGSLDGNLAAWLENPLKKILEKSLDAS